MAIIEHEISPDIEHNKRILEERVGLNKSFDVIFREMSFGGRKTGLFVLNGFAKDNILTDIINRLTYLNPEQIKTDLMQALLQQYIPHIQVKAEKDMNKAIQTVLAGSTALFIDQETSVLLIDAKTFPVRTPEEPTIERVVRGSRDGFVETLLTNVALLRRRIRDPGLMMEVVQIGKRTQTDVCLSYIDDIADKKLVMAIKQKLSTIDIDGIPMGDKQLEESLISKSWNPYPVVRYSERPDVVATHLLEGHVVLFVDTSPSIIILPTTFFHHIQHAEEYRQTPFVGTYLIWVRYFGIFASLLLLPLWLLVVIQPELKPPTLEFIGPMKTGKLPLIAQFLFAEVGVDLMRMAAVHTPNPIGIAMGLISAILIGDIAIKTGLFINEVILYMAVAAIGMFATPSYELGLANRIVRIGLLIAVAVFKVPGFVIGSTLILLILLMQRSFNSPYLWPFIPFNAKALLTILVRRPIKFMKKRPSIAKTLDSTKQ